MNILLFAATVLIWGTTWIAISLQMGAVPVVVSVFYRFLVASVVFLLALAVLRRLQFPKRAEQGWVFAQALCLFSFNFIMFYRATEYIPSGIVSVVFSLATVFNAINARIFFKDRVHPKTVLAGVLGVGGLSLLFVQELAIGANIDTLLGLGYASAGTMLFSLGNMVSRRNSAAGLSLVKANAWGMLYGALVLLVVAAFTKTSFVTPPNATYWAALLYLAIIGSVVGFTAYLMLVARLGSAKAAYATVLFPIVALALSSAFEGYSWSWVNGLGLAMALVGNAVMFTPTSKRA